MRQTAQQKSLVRWIRSYAVLDLDRWSLVVLKDKLTVFGPVLGIGPRVLGPGFDLGPWVLVNITLN